MKILVDINHPAHVHYFKNFIKIMKGKGHIFLVTSRNKEYEHFLLQHNNISYIDRGFSKKGLWGKIFYYSKAEYCLYKFTKKFKPNLIISFGTPFPSHTAKYFKIPHISFNDTEHAKLHHLFTDPFSEVVLTPNCYFDDLGEKHIRFKGYMELCYLHQNYFIPNNDIFDLLGLKNGEKYIILRFVSWQAVHDLGQTGLTNETKIKLVDELSKYGKIFISSEAALPNQLEKYKLKLPPDKIHNVLSFASLFVGESATMASECAMLGTPAIYVNSLNAGTIEKLEKKYKLIFGFRNSNGVLEKAIELINQQNLKSEFQKRRQKMLSETIDVTAFMVWFIENYPESYHIMKSDPNYQNRFAISGKNDYVSF